jgi:hypothetical protein
LDKETCETGDGGFINIVWCKWNEVPTTEPPTEPPTTAAEPTTEPPDYTKYTVLDNNDDDACPAGYQNVPTKEECEDYVQSQESNDLKPGITSKQTHCSVHSEAPWFWYWKDDPSGNDPVHWQARVCKPDYIVMDRDNDDTCPLYYEDVTDETECEAYAQSRFDDIDNTHARTGRQTYCSVHSSHNDRSYYKISNAVNDPVGYQARVCKASAS